MAAHCCPAMKDQVEYKCAQHANIFDCPDALISYSARFGEYGFIVHDGGQSTISIAFCPWCGAKLAASRREQWFSELEALGFDDPWQQAIPEKYADDAWYSEV